MNADRMIAVFLSGVLVGGTVVYLAPTNGLTVGVPSMHQGAQVGGPGQGPGGQGGKGAGGQSEQAGGSTSTQGGGGQGAGGQGGGGQGAGGEGGQASGGQAGGGEGGQGGGGQGGGGEGGQAPGGQGGGEGGQGGGEGGASPTMGSSGPGAAGGMDGNPGEGQGGNGMGSEMSGAGEPTIESEGSTGESILSAMPSSGSPRGATRLLRHLQIAPTLWKAQAEAALASKDPKVKALAQQIATHAAAVPSATDRLPPNTEIVSYLVDSKLLLERMKLAGMDVSSLESQVDEVSRRRR